MRLIFAVLAIVGIAIVTRAGPIGETTPSGIISDPHAEYELPFDLYTIPAQGNRSLENFVAVFYLVHFDSMLYSFKMVKFENDMKVDGKIPSNAEAAFDGFLSNWEHMTRAREAKFNMSQKRT